MMTDDFLVLLLFGAAFGYFTSTRRSWLWGLVLGILFSAIRIGLGLCVHLIDPSPNTAELFWAYSEFYLPTFGAIVGVVTGARLRTARHRRAVA